MNDSQPDRDILRVVPTGAALGADVEGIDLSRPLEAPTFAAISQAWAEHLVLRFRRQRLGDADLVRFSGRFGELDHCPPRPDQRGELGGSLRQYLGFGAGRVIFGQPGNILEQLRSGIVVQPARGHRLGLLRQTGEHIGAKRGVDPACVALNQLQPLACRHRTHKSFASRSPVNCQRWWG